MVWNRLRYVKDPDSGKRVSRLNPPAEWITTEVPQLRIIDDELWSQVKSRQLAVRTLTAWQADPVQTGTATQVPVLGTGEVRGVRRWVRDVLARSPGLLQRAIAGTCTNRRTISRQEIESRVLIALRDKLMRRDLFEEFCREYVKELNRLRMEHRAKVSQGRQELAVVEREIRKLVRAIKDGVSATSIKKELLALEARQAELQQKLEAPEMPELLHPRMADVYREKVTRLCQALEHEDSRLGATTAIRGLD